MKIIKYLLLSIFILANLIFTASSNASAASSNASEKEIIVLGVHGLGARAAWLNPLKEKLEAKNITFIAKDLPGFGLNHKDVNPESPYKAGHVDSYNEWLNFVDNEINTIKAESPNAKLIVFGHSLGGLISTNSQEISQANALILSVPAYSSGSNFNPKFLIETAWKYIVKIIQGKDEYILMPVSEKIHPNPHANDPYRTKAVTANLLLQINQLQSKTKTNLENITMPLLMLQIQGDKLVGLETQKDYFEKMPSENKTFKSYEGFDHDWLTNPGTDEIFDDIMSFIE